MTSSKRKLVYIVDDDPDDRQIILDAFLEHQQNIDYVFVENAAELLNMLDKSTPEQYPSVIILDLNMPGMIGLQALKNIRADKAYYRIPIVVLTTSNLMSDRKRSYELGANCFLTKPIQFADLVAITRSISKMYFQEEFEGQSYGKVAGT